MFFFLQILRLCSYASQGGFKSSDTFGKSTGRHGIHSGRNDLNVRDKT